MKKTYRLIISLVLGLALVAALTGCGGNGGDADGFDTSSEITVVSVKTVPETRGAFVELMGIGRERRQWK